MSRHFQTPCANVGGMTLVPHSKRTMKKLVHIFDWIIDTCMQSTMYITLDVTTTILFRHIQIMLADFATSKRTTCNECLLSILLDGMKRK